MAKRAFGKKKLSITSNESPYFQIHLPAGDSPGFLIDWGAGSMPHQVRYKSIDWLSQGYIGVEFVGQGAGITNIKPPNDWIDANIFVVGHNGKVKFRDLSLYVGRGTYGKCVHFGFPNPNGPVFPSFTLETENVVLENPVRPGGAWGLFGYQNDFVIKNTVFKLANNVEHSIYAHGFASSKGMLIEDCAFDSSGAEGCKATARPSECLYVPSNITIRRTSFKNWHQAWSFRGGAGLVVQGACANVLVEDSKFYGQILFNPDGTMLRDKARCIAIDDGGWDHYDFLTGARAANGTCPQGNIIVRRSGISHYGAYPNPWNNNIIRIGTIANGRMSPYTALSFRMKTCGVYGQGGFVSLSAGPGGAMKNSLNILDCNTALLRDLMHAQGMYAEVESKINGVGPLRPVSQGAIYP